MLCKNNNCRGFLSTPSARRATHRPAGGTNQRGVISIHALREEGDLIESGRLNAIGGFLSTPSARRATPRRNGYPWVCLFLSTPSARRATMWPTTSCFPVAYFYPRPPRGGRQKAKIMAASILEISIHALREEGDPWRPFSASPRRNFYPRPPRGGRREVKLPDLEGLTISIHALREEGDACVHGGRTMLMEDFYPRPPRGGRRPDPAGAVVSDQFLSTPSARRATRRRTPCLRWYSFLSTPSARRATCLR